MKVIVDYDVCASTGACMQVCPEVFEVRSDGYLYVLQEEPGEELQGRARPPSCGPTGAITSRTAWPDSGCTGSMPGPLKRRGSGAP